ncbi:site-specific DNA-methyltransferase [Leptospira sp. FAT2]|uniref:DNA-methyltransferase n=1 Tax=Leptospira sanjuanensis TaxID=2879643 RepID=UPI001EE99C94|nr:site-specific DNA-methyltransferase [Leptospira sanjuanensis]MCG6195637.1 site-specific DNA-methyltransferase [Leptospira sanjuanensis]
MSFEIICGSADTVLKDYREKNLIYPKFDCLVTSPPYFQKRKYLDDSHPSVSLEIGRERKTRQYFSHLALVFREAAKHLKDSATVFVNIGDSFQYGQAIRIPSGFVDFMKEEGYHFVQEIIWAKSISTDSGNVGSCKPESVRRRFTNSHEYVLFFVRDMDLYYFNAESVSVPISQIHHNQIHSFSKVKETSASEHSSLEFNSEKEYERYLAETPTSVKNRILENKIKSGNFTARRRSVWQIPTPNSRGRHTAVGPERLFEICVLAGCPEGGIVLDPFAGEGTVGKTALKNNRRFVGIDLDERSCAEANKNLVSYLQRAS